MKTIDEIDVMIWSALKGLENSQLMYVKVENITNAVAALREASTAIDRLKAQCITVTFLTDRKPVYRQGYPVSEMEELADAAQVQYMSDKLDKMIEKFGNVTMP